MLEFHDKPNEPWYARVTAGGEIELNPADVDAEEKLHRNHAPLWVLLQKGKRRSGALKNARNVLRRVRRAGLPSQAKEIDDVLRAIDSAEPDVAE